MEYRVLGRTGVSVSVMGLGTAMFGSNGNTDRTAVGRIFDKSFDAGINLVDTNDIYSDGEAEQIVGQALRGRRDGVFLATKFGSPVSTDLHARGASRRWIFQAVEASLTRLQTEWIDLYQLHRPDPGCDISETLEALTDLRTQGKIRYFGSSTMPATDIVEAQWTSQRDHLGRFSVEQAPYSVVARGGEVDTFPVCQRHGIGLLVWSPLAGGWLSGAFRRGSTPPAGRPSRMAQVDPAFESAYDIESPANEPKLAAVEALAALADEIGISLIHLALAFAAEHPAVSSILIGPENEEHLDSQLGAVHRRLTLEVLDRIDTIVPPGVTINPFDRGYAPSGLETSARRRSP